MPYITTDSFERASEQARHNIVMSHVALGSHPETENAFYLVIDKALKDGYLPEPVNVYLQGMPQGLKEMPGNATKPPIFVLIR